MSKYAKIKKRAKVKLSPFSKMLNLSGGDHQHRAHGRAVILLQLHRGFLRFQLRKLSLDQQVGSSHQQLRFRLQLLLQLRFERHHQFALGRTVVYATFN